MDLVINPITKLSGKIESFPSKFHTLFASALASLVGGKSVIELPLLARDTQALLQAIERMGGAVKRTEERWLIRGIDYGQKPLENVVDVKNSGTALSFLTSIATVVPSVTVLNGDPQLRSRPMPALVKSLRSLGCEVYSTKANESPPFVVFGKRPEGGEIQLDGSNIHYLPALLLPCPYAKRHTVFSFGDSKSLHKFKLVSELMNLAGANFNKRGRKLEVLNKPYRAFRFTIPRELANAVAFVLATVLTESELEIKGLEGMTNRDILFLNVLRKFGIEFEISRRRFYVEGNQRPRRAELDLSLLPELLPFFAVLACKAEGKTVIKNIGEARRMKSDRVSAIAKELRRMGGRISGHQDTLLIKGPVELKGCEVDGHRDYAVIAALVLAGLLAKEETVVRNGAWALGTSYPRFVSTFKELGADIGYAR